MNDYSNDCPVCNREYDNINDYYCILNKRKCEDCLLHHRNLENTKFKHRRKLKGLTQKIPLRDSLV